MLHASFYIDSGGDPVSWVLMVKVKVKVN